MGKGKSKAVWSGMPIEQLIDRELARNSEIRSGMAAYAGMIADFEKTGDGETLLHRLIYHASLAYRKTSHWPPELVLFEDRGIEFLFDIAGCGRTVLVWGVSSSAPPNSRDNEYHAQFPRAGDSLDKGHAFGHAQGGFEGGPNYFKQARRLNQARSNNGKLWRAIETYLAANAGLSAFIRLIYAKQNDSEKPDEVEYGLLSRTGQFRAVVFPNA